VSTATLNMDGHSQSRHKFTLSEAVIKVFNKYVYKVINLHKEVSSKRKIV
jgi:hypothetical protein